MIGLHWKQADVIIRNFNQRMLQDNEHKKQDTLLITRLRVIGLNRIQIARIIEALEDTCLYCCNADSNCQCQNDE